MAEPANRKTNAAGGKFYVHPLTDEKFDSVTTILDLWDKGGLKIWAGMVAAEMAFDLIPQMMASVLVPDCTNTYNRCYEKHGRENKCERCPCGDCERCVYRRVAWRHAAESARRAQEGTECHEAINLWVTNGGAEVSLRDEVKPYFATFLQWTRDYGLEPNGPRDLADQRPSGEGSWEQTEVTLLNRKHMYGGTSDAAIWIRRGTPLANALLDRLGVDEALIRVDYKTREKDDERLYSDMPMQGLAYEKCDLAMLPDGREFPAPKTVAQFVLQLRPSSYTFEPMVSEGTFEAFLGVLTAYRWTTAHQWSGTNKTGFGLHVPKSVEVPVARAVETIRTVMDAEVIEDPAGVDFAAVQEAVAIETDPRYVDDDPWAVADTSPPWPADPEPLPPLEPVKAAPRKAAPRKAAKSATAKADPFVLAQDAPSTGNPTMASMGKGGGGAGAPQLALLDEDIPF